MHFYHSMEKYIFKNIDFTVITTTYVILVVYVWLVHSSVLGNRFSRMCIYRFYGRIFKYAAYQVAICGWWCGVSWGFGYRNIGINNTKWLWMLYNYICILRSVFADVRTTVLSLNNFTFVCWCFDYDPARTCSLIQSGKLEMLRYN